MKASKQSSSRPSYVDGFKHNCALVGIRDPFSVVIRGTYVPPYGPPAKKHTPQQGRSESGYVVSPRDPTPYIISSHRLHENLERSRSSINEPDIHDLQATASSGGTISHHQWSGRAQPVFTYVVSGVLTLVWFLSSGEEECVRRRGREFSVFPGVSR